MSAYFITAIGTGVGKTFTSYALLAAARAQGQTARGFKPIISGWQAGEESDTAHIIHAMGGNVAVEDVSPWRFAAPLSPHRAAALEQTAIDTQALLEWSRARAAQPGLTLIEGVGGVMVPLTNGYTTLDWMKALNLPVILVTGSYLGSISHTLTAMAVLRQADIRIAALVMNESADASVPFTEAIAGLSPFIDTIPLRIFQPRVSSPHEAQEIHALLAQL